MTYSRIGLVESEYSTFWTGERFQDGAIIANNPAVIALHEAQHLWPGRPLDVLVSVGTGKVPYERRETKRTGGWGLIDTFGEYMVKFKLCSSLCCPFGSTSLLISIS